MFYIVYSSITFATGIKNKFRYDREKISIMHTPSEISGGGCSYCLVTESYEKVLEILKASEEYGVKVKGVFQKNNGIFTEKEFPR